VSRCFYIDEPDVDVPIATANAVGVLYWKLDADNYEAKLAEIKAARGYNYEDVVDSTKIPDFAAKVATFAKEHLHDDEEIRFCLDGSGFFDVRDQLNGDKWLRLVFARGDLIVLPAGINHRFVVDADGYFKVLRLFCGDPVWTAHPREETSTDTRPARAKYVADKLSIVA
jgi:1,2-dihydroxy-3-keto-5-methylthiopentene dioxygenase